MEQKSGFGRGEGLRMAWVLVFIVGVMVYTHFNTPDVPGRVMLIIAAMIGGYMALNIGAMMLVSSARDAYWNNFGYVLSFNYGDLKTWRKGTYNIWARYYYQPRYTFIAPSMNGRGGWMNGFKGFGMGINYTIAKNWIATLEYYNLRDILYCLYYFCEAGDLFSHVICEEAGRLPEAWTIQRPIVYTNTTI